MPLASHLTVHSSGSVSASKLFGVTEVYGHIKVQLSPLLPDAATCQCCVEKFTGKSQYSARRARKLGMASRQRCILLLSVLVGTGALTFSAVDCADVFTSETTAAGYSQADDNLPQSGNEVLSNRCCQLSHREAEHRLLSQAPHATKGDACLQAYSDGAAVSVPGRLLLQNGEPLSEFKKQLQQCRTLRGAQEKRCKALVCCTPCSGRTLLCHQCTCCAPVFT